jgi:predicted ABC-type transport system involved in lysophospholipase L1 biosynthesis ATPase subunit
MKSMFVSRQLLFLFCFSASDTTLPSSVCVVIEGPKVLESRSVAELVLVLGLDHRRPLTPQQLDGGEEVDHALVTHALQDDGQRDKDARATNAP